MKTDLVKQDREARALQQCILIAESIPNGVVMVLGGWGDVEGGCAKYFGNQDNRQIPPKISHRIFFTAICFQDIHI